MLEPKVPRACSKCDAEVGPVRYRNPDGRPARVGPDPAGAQKVTLVHLDGTTSDHTLCADCMLEPRDLSTLWARAVLLYAQGISRASPLHRRYAENLPMGILHVRTVEAS